MNLLQALESALVREGLAIERLTSHLSPLTSPRSEVAASPYLSGEVAGEGRSFKAAG
jgi:hypothetical protein